MTIIACQIDIRVEGLIEDRLTEWYHSAATKSNSITRAVAFPLFCVNSNGFSLTGPSRAELIHAFVEARCDRREANLTLRPEKISVRRTLKPPARLDLSSYPQR